MKLSTRLSARYVLLGSLVVLLCGAREPEEVEHEFESVSLVALIANPEKYDNDYVLVHGVAYLDSKNGINAIFLTREDKVKGNGKNGVCLFLAPSLGNADRLNNAFVTLRGRFRANIKGRLDSFSGSISDVDVIKASTTQVP